MNNQELTSKVHSAMYAQCRKRGYAAPVDVLMDLGVLPKRDARLCKEGGAQAVFLLLQTVGRQEKSGQGHPLVIPLRFSKTGAQKIVRSYVINFMDSSQIAKMRELRRDSNNRKGDKSDISRWLGVSIFLN